MTKQSILVVMGGPSDENAVSLKSGRTVMNALKRAGLKPEALEISNNNPSAVFKQKLEELGPDICFLALHGKFGEDGEAQKILSSLRISYTGSRPDASLKAFNKLTAKKIFLKNNIPTPAYFSLKQGMAFSNGLAYPLIVKPACQGSTIGVKTAKNKKEMPSALDEAFKYGEDALIEEFIKGRELTAGILGEEALPIVEIRHRTNSIFDYNAKYDDPDTQYIVPAEIPKDIEARIKELALSAHMSLGLKDFSRVDLILGDDGIPYVLEANTIPGLSQRSLFPMACKAAGISFEEMCCRLLKMAKMRSKVSSSRVYRGAI